MPRKTPHVHFVNHCLGRRPLQRPVAFPVIIFGIDGDALHCLGCRRTCGPAIARRNCHGARVRVQQNAACIEPLSIRRIPRPMDAISVQLASLDIRHEDVPVVIRTVRRGVEIDYPSRDEIVLVVEQHYFNLGRPARIKAEIRPVPADLRSGWVALAAPDHELRACQRARFAAEFLLRLFERRLFQRLRAQPLFQACVRAVPRP
jgi:hypothetical protein